MANLSDCMHSVSYGTQTIHFSLRQSERKSLAVHVHPNQDVEVVAPQTVSLEAIYKGIQKRASWIKTQQQYFSQFQPEETRRQYVSGETYRYLGKHYRLKVRQGDTNKVELTAEGFLFVPSLNPDSQTLTKSLVEEWFKRRAQEIFKDRLTVCVKKFQKPEEFTPAELLIRNLNKRWGSMNRSRKMTLNTKLIYAPIPCIDYVILHELCHIKHYNHGKSFLDLFHSVMPDWKHYKDQLENLGCA